MPATAAGTTHPSLRDLVTIVYRPRETIRAILDSGRPRWTWEVIALASVCSSYLDPDINKIQTVTVTTKVAVAVFALIVNALVWVGLTYLFAWAATHVGKYLEGTGTTADVRTAMAWSLVPQIWSIIFRIPGGFYFSQFAHRSTDAHAVLIEFVKQGGCGVAVVAIAIQLVLYAVIIFDASCTIGEAMHFSSLRGLATLAITSAIPIIVVAAAVIASNT